MQSRYKMAKIKQGDNMSDIQSKNDQINSNPNENESKTTDSNDSNTNENDEKESKENEININHASTNTTETIATNDDYSDAGSVIENDDDAKTTITFSSDDASQELERVALTDEVTLIYIYILFVFCHFFALFFLLCGRFCERVQKTKTNEKNVHKFLRLPFIFLVCLLFCNIWFEYVCFVCILTLFDLHFDLICLSLFSFLKQKKQIQKQNQTKVTPFAVFVLFVLCLHLFTFQNVLV